MKLRVITGAGLIALLLLALYTGGWFFSLLWLAAVALSLREMFVVLSASGHRPVAWPAWVALVAGFPAFALFDAAVGIRVTLAISLFCCLLATVFVLFRSAPRLEDLLLSVMPLMTVTVPGLCMLGLMGSELKLRAFVTLAFFIPTLGDSVAYLVGIKIGRIRLNPPVSPLKTVEGAVAGLAGSVAAAIAVFFAFSAMGAKLPSAWHFLALGLLGGIVGQVGDLFASLVKRYCSVKDYGKLFPGHGGMMDRLDSILFVSALVFAYRAFLL